MNVHSFILFLNFNLFEGQQDREREDRGPIHRFIFQMPAVVGARVGSEPGTQCKSPTWVAGLQPLEPLPLHHSICFSRKLQSRATAGNQIQEFYPGGWMPGPSFFWIASNQKQHQCSSKGDCTCNAWKIHTVRLNTAFNEGIIHTCKIWKNLENIMLIKEIDVKEYIFMMSKR